MSLWLFRRRFLVGLLGSAMMPLCSQAADAGTFVVALNRKAYDQLAPKLSAAERLRRFSALLEAYADMPGFSALILDRTWDRASLQERQGFADAIAGYLVRSFGGGIRGVRPDELHMVEVVAEADCWRVATRIVGSDGGSVPVVWRVAWLGRGLRLIDVTAGGVSFASVLRSQFEAAMARGSSIGQLTAMLDRSQGPQPVGEPE